MRDYCAPPRRYLAITSLIGLVALTAGIVALVNQSETMRVALVASAGALWAVSTVRHAIGSQHPHDRAIATPAYVSAGRSNR